MLLEGVRKTPVRAVSAVRGVAAWLGSFNANGAGDAAVRLFKLVANEVGSGIRKRHAGSHVGDVVFAVVEVNAVSGSNETSGFSLSLP